MPSRRPVFLLVTLLFFSVSTAIAAASLWPIYGDQQFLLVAVGALLFGSAVAVAGALFRWRSAVVILVAFALFVATGVPLAVPSKAVNGLVPTADGLVELLSGLALGWKQLLTITLPVGDYQALLVPAFASVLTTTVVGLSIALRARWGELGAIAPAMLYLVGILFGPESVPWPVPLSIAMMTSLLLWLVWRRAYRRRAAIRALAGVTTDALGRTPDARAERAVGVRAVLAAALVMAIASAAAVVAVGGLPPTTDRTVLRSAIEQPFDPAEHTSPLASFRSYLRELADRRDLLSVTGLEPGERVRVATLDSYDGIVYAVGSSQVDSASGTFVRVPTRIDRDPVSGRTAEIAVRVAGYRGVWLPTVGDVAEVEFSGTDAARLRDDFYFNSTSGTGAVSGGLRADDEYRLTTTVPSPVADDVLAAAAPGSARVPRIEVVPESLSARLDEYTESADPAGQQLVDALAGLRRDGYISHGLTEEEPVSRSGHAADRITELLTAPRMIGDAEQYAVAAALMARQIGFPARVVMGFAPEVTGSGPTPIRGADVSAWIEVNTAGGGWVPLDPVPPVRPIPEEQPQDPTQIARPQTPVQPPPDDPEPRIEQTPPDATQDDPEPVDPILATILAVLGIVGWVALGLGILASPLLVIVAAKLRRRRLRRRAPTPIQRISGAWDEFRDEAVDHGYPVRPAATRSEFADGVGLEQSRTLAAVADRAVFAPGGPDAAEADQVWAALSEIAYSLDRGLTRWERFRIRISLRSLGGAGVRGLLARRGGPR